MTWSKVRADGTGGRVDETLAAFSDAYADPVSIKGVDVLSGGINPALLTV